MSFCYYEFNEGYVIFDAIYFALRLYQDGIEAHTVSGSALCLLMRFFFLTPVAAIDLRATANMNDASKIFYAGMNERIKDLVSAADRVQDHAEDALRFSADMASLLQKARRLESLVDRLDEYTSKQEAALSKK